MKAVWKWSIGSSLAAAAIVLGTVGVRLFAATEKPEPAAMYSQTGRDRAFADGVKKAKKSIYLRTTSISCVPFANELAQAAQRGVGVHIEMPMAPMQASQSSIDLKLVEVLATVGAWIEIGSKPVASYEGSYLLVDDQVFFYSAGPMAYSEPGVPHSYVRGKKG